MTAEIIGLIARSGLRVFDRGDLTKITDSVGLSPKYIPRLMSLMAQQGSIVSIGKGLYSLPIELLAGGPIHTFEIALKISGKGSISHRSAMVHHKLSDQMLSRVYITVPQEKGANKSSTKEYTLKGVRYNLIRVSPQHYWGVKWGFVGEARFSITDLEKTLIDGITNPEHCGGFREVLFAFERGIDDISAGRLFDYAKKTSIVTCKRLGWILEQMGEYPEIQEQCVYMPMNYYQRLDSSGDRKGRLNKRWNIMENF